MHFRFLIYKVDCEYELLNSDFDIEESRVRSDIDTNEISRIYKEDGCNLYINVKKYDMGYCIYITIVSVFCDSMYYGLHRLNESIFINTIYEKFLTYIIKEDE